MRALIFIAAIGFGAYLTAIAAATASSAASCRIGKPSYCFKYGGARCVKKNNAADKVAACAAWRSACLFCHQENPGCLEDITIYPDATARCSNCREVWSKCMDWIGARFYPNRLSN